MTREEALDILTHNWTRLDNPNYDSSELDKAFYMAIEALQGDMYCPNCGVRLVQETEYLEPTQTHGRLIDAEALVRSIRLDISITGKENAETVANALNEIMAKIADAPTVQADRMGEWICKGDYAVCSKCGGSSGTQFDGVEPIPKTTAFCPHCSAKMKGGDSE